MVAPQLLINTKTLELEKQPETNKEDDNEEIDLENKEEHEAEMKEKEDDNDSIDPAKDTCNGNNKNRKESSRPFLTYIISPILVFKGLTIAIVGVSFNSKDGILKLIISSLQAFLWEDKSVYPYFVLLGLHEFLLGCFFIAH